MGDQDQGRSGLKEQNKPLSLNKKSREVSLERQASARESQIAELRSVEVAPSAKPTESPPDVKLDSAFASILKKKVYLLVDTENALSQSHRRIKHLEEQFQQNTVPKGLKIKPVKAKSKSEDLQKKFDDILHKAELKLLEATLENLRKESLETEHSIARCKEDINATIGRWRTSFPLKDENSTEKADLLTKYANKFVDDFYFQCMVTKTSKALQDALNIEEKAKTQPGMETDFALTEESVRDIVKAEVQRLSSQKVPRNSRGRSRRRDNAAPSDVNKVHKPQRRGRSSSKGKNNRQRSQSAGKKQKQRGRSSGSNRRVSLSKNGGGRGTGHGT